MDDVYDDLGFLDQYKEATDEDEDEWRAYFLSQSWTSSGS